MATTKGRGDIKTTGNQIVLRDGFFNKNEINSANAPVTLSLPNAGTDFASNSNELYFTGKSFNELKLKPTGDTLFTRIIHVAPPADKTLSLDLSESSSDTTTLKINSDTRILSTFRISGGAVDIEGGFRVQNANILTLKATSDSENPRQLTATFAGTLSSISTIPLLEEPLTWTEANTFNDVVKVDTITDTSDNNLISKSGSNINVGTSTDTVVVQGNLTVQGDVTTVNTEQVTIEDPNIVLNFGGDDTSAKDAGITVERDSAAGSFIFDSSLASKWKAGLLGQEKQIVDVSSPQTLTNKTLGSGTTAGYLTGITDSNISSTADITRTKLAPGTANHVLINEGSGEISSEAQLSISRGGTGASNKTAAFNALSPTTTNEDLIVRRGGSNVRLPAGGTGSVLSIVDGVVTWSGSVGANPITGKGQIIAGDGSGDGSGITNLNAPTSDNQVLMGASAETTGLKWSLLSDSSIAEGAAIDGSKISPNFADQNIVTTGSISAASGTISGILNVRGAIDLADNDTLRFGDSSLGDAEFFYDGTNFYLDLNAGDFIIRDLITNRFIFDDAGHLTATGNITAQGRMNADQISLGEQGDSLTEAVRADREIATGDGLFGGGNLTGDLFLSVDSTVARTNVAETFSSSLTVDGDLIANGNVGIGTSTPGVSLHINTSSPAIRLQDSDGTNTYGQVFFDSVALNIDSCSNTSNGYILFRGNNGSTTTEYARFDPNGNFGINDTSPSEKLDVLGNIRAQGHMVITRTVPSDFWGVGENNALHLPYGTMGSAGAYNVSITANGYRNTSSQWTSLGIQGSTAAAQIDLDTQTGDIDFRVATDHPTGSASSVPSKMILKGNGNLGIGVTPSNKLTVSGNADITGNLGIGITSPTEKLDVNGNINSQGRVYAEIATDVKRDLSDAMSIEDITSVAPTLDLDFSSPDRFNSDITFARASTATYYDGKTVAKAEENLIPNSQSSVSKFSTELTITNSTSLAPDESSTAFLLTENASGTGGPRFYPTDLQSRAYTAGAYYTLSVYLKAGTTTYGYLSLRNSLGNIVSAVFNLSTGAIANTYEYGVFTDVSAGIVDVGNGWYRCSVTGLSGQTVGGDVFVGPSDNTGIGGGGYPSQTMTGKTLYVWGLQKEQRDFATAYTKTTDQPITKYVPKLMTAAANEPRIDFDPITKEVKGLLIEESRENLLPYSEDFSNAEWSKGNLLVEANATIAPDGTLTAEKIIANTANSQHTLQETLTVSTGVAYTQSVYVKAGGLNKFVLRENTEDQYAVLVDLSANPPTAVAAGSSTNVGIEHIGNNWYRIWTDAQLASSTSFGWEIRLKDNNGNLSFTGDGYSGIYVWGAQLEEGAFPTSYIPTSGSAVTREADNASMTGDAFSEWYSPEAGSLYAEFTRQSGGIDNSGGGNTPRILSLRKGSVQSLQIRAYSDSSIEAVTGGASPALNLYRAWNSGELNKVVLGIASDNYAFGLNGGDLVVDSSANIFEPDGLYIGLAVTTAQLNGHIKRLAYWPTRLANDTLKEITSLKSKIPAAGAGGKGGGLIPSAVNEAADAKAGNHYLTDTSSSSFTMQLPSGAKGASLKFTDATGSWATNQLTLSPASGQKINGYSTDEDLVCDVANGWVELSWDDVNNLWALNTLAAPTVEEATSSVLGTVKKNRWQKKFLQNDIAASASDMSSTTGNSNFKFLNLEIGKVYKVSYQFSGYINGTEADMYILMDTNHDGNTLGRSIVRFDRKTEADFVQAQSGNSIIFTATTSTLTFSCSIVGSGRITGNGTGSETFAMLEELNNYEAETSDFT